MAELVSENPDGARPAAEPPVPPELVRPLPRSPRPLRGMDIVEAIGKWGPWFAGAVLFIIVTTASAVLIYAATKSDIAATKNDVAALRLELAGAKAELAHLKTERDELAGRMGNVERFLAQLVCREYGVDTPTCAAAMAAIGGRGTALPAPAPVAGTVP
jgi:hypothetical protein